MSEIVDDMLDGFLCQQCLVMFDDLESPGYPRVCEDCKKIKKKKKKKK